MIFHRLRSTVRKINFPEFRDPTRDISRFRYHSQAISQEKISEEIL